ncbi:hypothetical protein T492DRAFT_184988 [Pavlovales sp. CCMP2436]|nr:hypothetical protein T492DRAFT_184988 [Pavlovales sp. CCMP2436]
MRTHRTLQYGRGSSTQTFETETHVLVSFRSFISSSHAASTGHNMKLSFSNQPPRQPTLAMAPEPPFSSYEPFQPAHEHYQPAPCLSYEPYQPAPELYQPAPCAEHE